MSDINQLLEELKRIDEKASTIHRNFKKLMAVVNIQSEPIEKHGVNK